MKRRFSLFLAVVCMLTSLGFTTIAQAASVTSFTDVDSTTDYCNAIISLSRLGIINGYDNGDGTYSFKPAGNITRAEFTKIITGALGISNMKVEDNSTFSDISTHWAKNNILIAAGRGIVNGFEDGSFHPDDNVTYEQAVKMIVCATGYETAAIAQGGWPNGYIMQASQLGITKDVTTVTNQTAPATRGVVAQLMYNALEVEIPKYNATTGKLESDLDTFMKTYLGIIKEKCKIVGVEDKVTNDCPEKLNNSEMGIITTKNKDFVRMDFTTYTNNISTIEALVGQQATVYYREGKNGGANELVQIDTETTAKNTVTKVFSDDISSFSGSSFKYYEDKKTKSLTVKADELSAFYYNGKIVEDITSDDIENWLSPSSSEFIYGEVTFTDSGSDGSINIVEIYDYEFLVASKTPSTSDYLLTNKVKFKNGTPDRHISTITLDPDDASYKFTITDSNGANMAVTSIKTNDVCLIATSLDGELYTVKVNSNAVSGEISSYNSAEDEIVINNNTYKLCDYSKAYFDENDIEIKSGLKATFYVDVYGTVIYGSLTNVSSNYQYAYLISAYPNEDEEQKASFKIYTVNGGVQTYQQSGKIKFNGKNVAADEIAETLKYNVAHDDNNILTPDRNIYGTSVKTTNASQLVRIAFNGTTITEMNTIDPDGDYDGKTTEDTTIISPYEQLKTKTNYLGSNNFAGRYSANSSTTYLYIPNDRSNEDGYGRKTSTYFEQGGYYVVQPYNVNSSKVANLIVIYGAEASSYTPGSTTSLYTLSEDLTSELKDGEKVYGVSYYCDSKTVKTKTAEEENITSTSGSYMDIADLVVGDLFRVGTDPSKGFVNCEMIIDYNDVKKVLNGDTYDFTGSKFEAYTKSASYGHVYVANVVEVIDDGNDSYTIRLTRNGFNDEGKLDQDDPNYKEYVVTSNDSVTFLQMVEGKNKVISTVTEGGTDYMNASNLKSYIDVGIDCDKVAVYEYSTSTTYGRPLKMIMVYK